MPAVSVIIPTYNQARYIREALESVFMQTYGDFEVIIIDDGSTDNTKEIVKSFNHKMRYIYQENKGRGAARQRGVDESRGEYIAFLDSDDKWFPEKLEKQMGYIKRSSFSGLLHTKVTVIDGNGMEVKKITNKLNKRYMYGIKNGFNYATFVYKCPMFLSTALLPKKLIREINGFRKNYKVIEDFDFILRLSKICKVELLNDQLAYYRDYFGNASKATKEEVQKTYLLIFREQLRYLNSIVNPAEKRKIEKRIYEHLINFSYEIKDRPMASAYIKEYIGKEPLWILSIRGLISLIKLFTKQR